ncbi:MAG: MCE family protein [Bacteroidales bacterium]|nr:MCE family protein [Bacteroidales bacterium]
MKFNVQDRIMNMSKELKIGIFAVTILIVSFFMINYLRGKDIFDKEIELSAKYENVEGLVSSAPVFIKGYKAGKVTEVVYRRESDDFLVTCSVLKDFRIPKDSKMLIYGVDIMGGKGIRIDIGSSDDDAEDGDILASSSEPALLDGLASSVTPLLSKVGNTLDSLNVTVAGVNRMLSDQNQVNIARTLAHLERTISDFSKIAAMIEGRSMEIDTFISDLASLSSKIGSMVENADTAISGISSKLSSVDEDDLRGVVTSFKELLENINDPDGSIGKLLVDGSVYDSVDALLSDVDSLVKKIQENPKKYIKISVF